jgi:hypothetical protein
MVLRLTMAEFRNIPSNDKILFGVLIAVIVFNSMIPRVVEGLDASVYNVTTPVIVTGTRGNAPSVNDTVMSISGNFRLSDTVGEGTATTQDTLTFTFPANYFVKNQSGDSISNVKLTVRVGSASATPVIDALSASSTFDNLAAGTLAFTIPTTVTLRPTASGATPTPNLFLFTIAGTSGTTPIFKFGPSPIGITSSGFKIQSTRNGPGTASMPSLYKTPTAGGGSVDSSDSMPARQAQFSANITNLQNIEAELFAKLASESDPAARSELVTQINRIAKARGDLYNNMNDFSGQIEAVAGERHRALVQNSVAVNIIRDQIQNAQNTLTGLKEEKSNKMRLVEINNYYGKKYEYQTDIIKIIIITCVPILIISVLLKKGMIPNLIATGLITVIIAAGVITVARKIIDLNKRNDFNFDQYDHPFNPNAISVTKTETTNLSDANNFSLETSCVGPYCCTEGTTEWDSVTAKCVPVSAARSASSASATSS